jgi:hypothetical protein
MSIQELVTLGCTICGGLQFVVKPVWRRLKLLVSRLRDNRQSKCRRRRREIRVVEIWEERLE